MDTSHDLHIFVAIGGDDYIIAHDAEDARAVLFDLVGPEFFAPGHMYADVQFRQWPEDEPFLMTEIDEPEQPTESYLPAEWAERYGRCYLGGQA